MYGDKLRIIFWDRILSNNFWLVIRDVVDADDRFYINGDKDNYRKKAYLKYVTATPEKEKLVEEYNQKLKETEEFRMYVIKEIFTKI